MDVVTRTMFFLLFMCITLTRLSKGECIQSAASSNSSEMDILNNMNESTCMTLNGKSEETKPVIMKLQVNKTCVNGPDLNLLVFLSGHKDCSQQKILFVNHETSECSVKVRCQSLKGIPYSSNDTICLLKCSKAEASDKTYGLDLISGYQAQNLCSLQIYQDWFAPNGWIGPDAVLYRSFDTPEHLTLMEGTIESNFAPLVSGKINSAVRTDRTRREWIDLGIHTEACMTRPETCGAAGGAVSMWLRLADGCLNYGGLLTTTPVFGSGFAVYCGNGNLRYVVRLGNGYFVSTIMSPSGWTPVVINYIGPEDGQGIRIYYDGVQRGSDTSMALYSRNTGEGLIVFGRRHTDSDDNYGSVQLDELIFFNATLTDSEITMLSQY